MATAIYSTDYWKAEDIIKKCGFDSLRYLIATAIAEERERCATVALEQRCERCTDWDMACLAIAGNIRKMP